MFDRMVQLSIQQRWLVLLLFAVISAI
ncbi:MAG: hypothetical protein RLY58_2179, partial [Pseudomonadota bacterium]